MQLAIVFYPIYYRKSGRNADSYLVAADNFSGGGRLRHQHDRLDPRPRADQLCRRHHCRNLDGVVFHELAAEESPQNLLVPAESAGRPRCRQVRDLERAPGIVAGGHTILDEAPEKCPICNALKKAFTENSIDVLGLNGFG